MDLTDEKKESLKKGIFDAMSPRRQKYILKRGYEKWDPFEEPKDPIDMRMDRNRRTMSDLIREFMQAWDLSGHGNDYRKGAIEICMGIINEDERYIGMLDFAYWYRKQLDEKSTEISPETDKQK